MTTSPPHAAPITALRRSGLALGLALLVIALGLSLRLYGLGLGVPAVIVKYGGSVLWAVMLYWLIVALAPRLRPHQVAAVALVIAIAVELIRLVHTPWLDSFRLTLAGALLLGRIFSLWNIVAYAVGIGIGLSTDWTAST